MSLKLNQECISPEPELVLKASAWSARLRIRNYQTRTGFQKRAHILPDFRLIYLNQKRQARIIQGPETIFDGRHMDRQASEL